MILALYKFFVATWKIEQKYQFSFDFMISGSTPVDFPCDGKFPCGNCKLPDDKPLYLKGICADVIETTYDNQYYAYGIRFDKPYFR